MTHEEHKDDEFTVRPGEREGEGFVRYIREKVGDKELFEIVHNGTRQDLITLMRESLAEVDLSPANATTVAEAFGEKIEMLELDKQSEISLPRHMSSIARKIQRTLQGFIDR
jgi:hypothetical protein